MSFRKHAVFLAVSVAAWPAAVGAAQVELSAEEIIEKAIARGEKTSELTRERQGTLQYRLKSVIEKLDGDGDVDEREESVVEVYPVEGVPYTRIVSRQGQPLTKAELEEEDERERQFRLEQANKPSEDRDAESDEQEGLRFDGTIKERFVFDYEGEEVCEGRLAYVLSFEPSGKRTRPRSRIESAINKTAGRIWIDRETFEVQQIQFALQEKVRFLWGIAASISKADGVFQRKPLTNGGLWVPSRLSFTLNGRMLFKSLDRNQRLEWSQYR